MRMWLYNPKDSYKGEIFEGEAVAQAKAEGWIEAPYSDLNFETAAPKVTAIDPEPEQVPEKRKPGRKPNAPQTRKVEKSHK